jgi:hemolysin III
MVAGMIRTLRFDGGSARLVSPDPRFTYPTLAERRADGTVQSTNVVLAMAGCVGLAVLVGQQSNPRRMAALVAYGIGLLAMAVCSAVYSWKRDDARQMLYRHLDQAAIFLMIAGTYTPFMVVSREGGYGTRVLAVVWAIALFGVVFKLAAPNRFERLALPLYLLTGWAIVFAPGVLLGLPPIVVSLLVAGGMCYTGGIVFYRARFRFQEALWHGAVMAAAVCHYAAVVVAMG